MWLLVCATILLLMSGVSSARNWLYGLHREDVRRQLDALLFHGGLTALLSLYSLLLHVDGLPLALTVISVFAAAFGVLAILRDPPRELSRGYAPTSLILER